MNKSTDKLNKRQFKSCLIQTVETSIEELLAKKNEGEEYLTYYDAQRLSKKVRAIFRKGCNCVVPPEVETTCKMTEAILAPTKLQKVKCLKAVMSLAGVTGGMSIVIAAIGTALGWGAGLIATVTAFFTGASLAGPVGWGAAGIALTAISGYLMYSNNEAVNTERYINALTDGLTKSVDHIWPEYKSTLSAVQA